jgi:hypothetical protein
MSSKSLFALAEFQRNSVYARFMPISRFSKELSGQSGHSAGLIFTDTAIKRWSLARVAESVDAVDLKLTSRKGMRVRVPPRAPSLTT